jgi:hypothetical protein
MEERTYKKQNKKAKTLQYIESYQSFATHIVDSAVLNDNANSESIRVERNLVGLSNFVMEEIISKDSTSDILKYTKVFENSPSSEHKWSMLFAWGSVKKIQCFIANLY